MAWVDVPKPPLILIVDDEDYNVLLLETLLGEQGYATVSAHGGDEALELATDRRPDLILMDAMMPGLDGFQTVARLKHDPRTQPVPVIMVTALDDRASKLRALDAGAEEFLAKPVDAADLSVRVRNLLRLKDYGDFLLNHNRILEEQVRERTTQLESAYRDTVLTLVSAAEGKDDETGRHIRRIGAYCRVLASGMDMPAEFVDVIYQASPMHDIGKIGIPDSILFKPGRLTDDEWIVMRTHCRIGARILSHGNSPYTRMGAEIALNHHERWDGTGYPSGRKAEEIPVSARTMQICDVYDALRSARPYKPPLDHAAAVTIIAEGDERSHPGHFDPAVLACFLKLADRFAAIYDEEAQA
jgi:putative two-component system response regulator